MALQENKYYCIKCNEKYTNMNYKWCKPCQINYLKRNFTNWTSENEKIDNFIQEKQLKINGPYDLVFEWISYSQFLDIKEVDKDDFSTVYLAKWEDGPLSWNCYDKKYVRQPDKEIALKHLHNLQNIDELLNEVSSMKLKV